MAEFRYVGRIMVALWGRRVGMIVSSGSREESYAFQYDRKFLKSGIEISPLMMPLRRTTSWPSRTDSRSARPRACCAR